MKCGCNLFVNLKNPFLKSKWIGTPLKPEYMKQITGLAGIATATLLPLSILSKINLKSQSQNTYEKQEEIKIEPSSDDYCKVIDKYKKILSDYEWNKMCSSIEEDWGCSFEELYRHPRGRAHSPSSFCLFLSCLAE